MNKQRTTTYYTENYTKKDGSARHNCVVNKRY